MKKRISAIILATVVLITCLCGCSAADNTEIRNLITEFEYSCNTLDIDAMLDCITPEISDKIRLAVGFAGMFSDKSSDEMFEQLANTIMNNSDISGNEFFSSVKITVSRIEAVKERAIVDTVLEYTLSGDSYKKEAIFECVTYLDKWYISNLDIR